MSKELDYLDKILNYQPLTLVERTIIECIKEKIQRLESIDNANPSEALECFENMQYRIASNISTIEYTTIKQALLKAQELTKENELLKAFIADCEKGDTPLKYALFREKKENELLKAQEQEKENAELRQKAQFLEEEYNNLMEDKDNLESELFKLTTPKQYVDELKLVEKKLKALEIIKEKECDVNWLKYCIKENLIVEAYNSGYPEYHKKLTQEEFDLLKEVLE